MLRVCGAALLMLLLPWRGEATETWVILEAGRPELIVPAAGVTPDGVPLLAVAALAEALDLTVGRDADQVIVQDERGTAWRAVDGAPALFDLMEQRPPMPGTVVIRDGALYLPLSTLAELTGRRMVLDPPGRVYLFGSDSRLPSVDHPPDGAPHGWEPFRIDKTLEEREAGRRLDGLASAEHAVRGRIDEVLPPRHGSVRMVAGVGAVTGADWAGEFDASGTFAGLRVDTSAFATMGRRGTEVRNASAIVQPPSEAWALQAGDLLSEVRGVGRGVRFSWSPRPRWHQSVGVEQSRDPFAASAVALSYRAEVPLFSALTAGGEAASDGSAFVKGRFAAGRSTVDAFWHHDGGRDARQVGGLISIGVARGLSVGGGTRITRREAEEERSYLAGVVVPLDRFGNVTIQHTHVIRGDSTQRGTGLAASLPIGPFRLFERFHWTDMGISRPQAGTRSTGQQLQSVASYSPTARFHVVYQSATQWHPGGAARRWDEIQTAWQLSRSTWIYSTNAFPRVTDAQRFRLRLAHAVATDSSVSIEYGQLPAFQTADRYAEEASRLLIMFRHGFGVRTPARGGVLSGRITDEAGRPLPGAAVRLGPYLAVAGADGAYGFRQVPTGEYPLELEHAQLPANYAAAGLRRTVAIGARTSARVDLQAVALHAVHGRAYIDRNGNREFDRGEETAGVVVILDGRVTMTDAEGRYAFYNLAPGTYSLRVDRSRLRHDLEPEDGDADVRLTPDGAADSVDFRMRRREKPVRMQEEL